MESAAGYELLVIGAGNMGGAIVRGTVRAKVVEAGAACVIELDAGKREAFVREGLCAAASVRDAAPKLGGETMVLWAVKPQMFADAAAAYAEVVGGLADGARPRLGVSIMAGVTAARVMDLTGMPTVFRTMPNLPAQIGLGVTAVCRPVACEGRDAARVERLMGAVGTVVPLAEELVDAFTAVAGSGPAYVFYLAEAMVRGAMAEGMDAAAADEMVRRTIVGAAALLAARTGVDAAALRAEVTSKGGTTAAAVAVMDGAGVMAAIERAIGAGTRRGRELGAARGK